MRKDIGGAAGVRRERVVAQVFGSLRVVFGKADAAKDVARLKIVVIDIQGAHGQLDGCKLVGIIKNGKVRGETSGRSFTAQQTRTKGMKSGEPGTFRRNSGAEEQVGDAILHFFGRFVGESDSENGLCRHAARNQIGHAESYGAGLAGAGSGQNQNRAFGSFRSEALFRIERFKKVLHESMRKRLSDTLMLADGEWRSKWEGNSE